MSLKSFILVDLYTSFQEYNIGRDAKNYIVIDDDSISKVHSIIKLDP